MNIKEFLKELNDKDDVIVVFHNDGDGICSAVMLKKYMATKEIKPYLISQPMPVDENLIDRIKTGVADKIIFLDMAIDQHPELLRELKTIAKIAIIDHHQIHEDMNKNGIVHYNPRFNKADIYQSCGYVIYKLLDELIDMSDYLWLAAVAMTSDYDLKDSEDLVKRVKERFGVEDLYKSDISKTEGSAVHQKPMVSGSIGRVVDMISSARATRKISSEEIVEILDKTDNISVVLKNEKLLESYKIIDNEINGIVVDAEANAEKTGNVIFYELKTSYNVKSQIATAISQKHLDKLVIIYQIKGAKVKISVRNQTARFAVCDILKEAVKGLKASAGGHENAGGGTVYSGDWEKFKDRVKELVD